MSRKCGQSLEQEALHKLSQRKKNKNDFYRFLLSQQHGLNSKVHNDILIPRSILKQNGEQMTKRKNSFEEFVPLDEMVMGQQLHRNNPLLSPKFNQIVLDHLAA